MSANDQMTAPEEKELTGIIENALNPVRQEPGQSMGFDQQALGLADGFAGLEKAEGQQPEPTILANYEPEEFDRIKSSLSSSGDIDLAMQASRGALAWSMMSALNIDEQTARKTQELAKAFKMPKSLAREKIAELGDLTEARKVLSKLYEKDEQGQLKYPVAAAWVSDPWKMKSLSRDADTVLALERLMTREFGTTGERAQYTLEESLKGMARGLANTSVMADDVIGGGLLHDVRKGAEHVLDHENFQMRGDLEIDGLEGFAHDVLGVAPQLALTYATAGLAGPTAGAMTMGAQATGGSYERFRAAGLDVNTAASFATTHGLTEMALEKFQIDKAFDTLAPGSIDLLKKKGVGYLLKKLGVDSAKLLGGEMAPEYLQSLNEEAWAILAESTVKDIGGDEAWERMGEAHREGIRAALAVSVYSSMAVMGKAGYELNRFNRMRQQVEFYNGLVQGVAGADDATGVNEFAKAVIEKNGAPVEQVYVRAEDLENAFMQAGVAEGQELSEIHKNERRLMLQEMQRELEIDDASWHESKATGKRIGVNVIDWAHRVAGTDVAEALGGRVAFDADGMNIEDQAEFNERLRADLDRTAEEAEKRARENQLPLEFDKLRKDLINERGFSAEEADQSVALWHAAAKQAGKIRKNPLTVEEWLRKNPLTFEAASYAEKVGATDLEQPMYRNPRKSLGEFLEYARSKESEGQKQSYFSLGTNSTFADGIELRINTDLPRHIKKRHEGQGALDIIDKLISAEVVNIEESIEHADKGAPFSIILRKGDQHYGIAITVGSKAANVITVFKGSLDSLRKWQEDTKPGGRSADGRHQLQPQSETVLAMVTPGNKSIQHIPNIVNQSAALESPEFKAWFGDSKVVDKQGRPLVVYHGTNASFDAFDGDTINSVERRGDYIGEGFYFSGSPQMAEKYARQAKRLTGSGDEGTMPVYLSISNPLVINGSNDGKALRESFGGDAEYFSLTPKAIREELQRRGYDGLIDNTYDQYAVFDPSQIKSANNRGTFDPSTPNIYHQMAGEKSIGNSAALRENLWRAQWLAKNGGSRESIWKETGWAQGSDGKWRYEISDEHANLNLKVDSSLLDAKFDTREKAERAKRRLGGEIVEVNGFFRIARKHHEKAFHFGTLSEVLEHDALYSVYPWLRDIAISINIERNVKRGGSFQANDTTGLKDSFISVKASSISEAKEVLLHEIQHVIQEYEDFGRGANPAQIRRELREDADYYDRMIKSYNSHMKELVEDGQGRSDEYLEILDLRENARQIYETIVGPDGSINVEAYDKYKRHAGEIEARDASHRDTLTAEERRKTPPALQEDAIVVFGGQEFSLDSAPQQSAPRGATRFTDRGAVVRLFETADKTTLLHECFHVFHEDMASAVHDDEATEQAERDLAALEEFVAKFNDDAVLEAYYNKNLRGSGPFGNTDFTALPEQLKDRAWTVARAETLADAWETYLAEGKAPSLSLASAFRSFKSWFLSVYKAVTGSGVTPTESVREVFDRMLATESEIEEARQYYGTQSELLDYLNTGKWTIDEAQRKREEAKEIASEKLLAQHLRALQSAQNKEASIDARARQVIDNDPVYAAVKSIIRKGGLSRTEAVAILGSTSAEALDFTFDGLLREGGGSIEESALYHGFKSDSDMLNEILKQPNPSDLLDEIKGEMRQEAEISSMPPEAAADAIHNDASLESMTRALEELRKRIDDLNDGEILGADYEMHRSHDAIRDGGTEAARLKHYHKILREISDLEAEHHNWRPSRAALKQAFEEFRNSPAGLALEIREKAKGRIDFGDHAPSEDVKRKYHSAKAEWSAERLAETDYHCLNGRSIEEHAADIGVKPLDLVVDAFASEKTVAELRQDLKRLAEEDLREGTLGGLDRHIYELTSMRDEMEATLGIERIADLDFNPMEEAEAPQAKPKAIKSRADARAFRDAAREYLRHNIPLHMAARPDLYAQTEARYNREALEAARKGDTLKAAELHEKATLNHALTMEAHELRKERDKIRDGFGTRKITGRLKECEHGYREAVLGILSGLGLNDKLKPEGQDPFAALREITNGEDPGLAALLPTLDDLVPEWIQTLSKPEPWTFEHLREVNQTVELLLKTGRGQLETLKSEFGETVAAMADSMIQTLEQLPDKKEYDPDSTKGRLRHGFDRAIAGATMIEFLADDADGNPLLRKEAPGPMHRLAEVASEREEAHQEMKRGIMARIEKPLSLLGAAARRIESEYGGKVFDIPGLAPSRATEEHNWRWTSDRLLAVLLNMGNADNLHSLQAGHGFSREQLSMIPRLFEANELAAVQEVWDAIEDMYPELDAVVFRMTNRHPERIEPQESIVYDRNGQGMKWRGGYYPLAYDSRLSHKAAEHSEQDALRQFKQGVYRPSQVRSGMTKQRLRDEESGQLLVERPVNLSMSVLFRHIGDTSRVITHAEFLREANAITKEPAWRDTFIEKFGREKYGAVRQWLNAQARPDYKGEDSQNQFVRAADKSRVMAGRAILGFKIKTGLKQRLSLFSGLNAMRGAGPNGWKWFTEGFKLAGLKTSLYGSTTGELIDEVHARSKYMKNRADQADQNMHDAANQFDPMAKRITFNGKEYAWQEIADTAFWWIKANDLAATYPLWLGAYNQALGEKIGGVDAGQDSEAQKAAAARYADSIIRMSQPSSNPMDLAEIQRNQILKLWTSFMTWTLKFGNRLMHQSGAYKRGRIDGKQLAEGVALELLAPRFMMLTLAAVLYADDDEPELSEWFTGPLSDAISWIPIIRDVPRATTWGASAFAPAAMAEPVRRGGGVLTLDPLKAMTSIWRTTEFITGLPVSNLIQDISKEYDRMTEDEGGNK